MEETPEPKDFSTDSGCISGFFSKSHIFESTPNSLQESDQFTPRTTNTWKRSINGNLHARNINDVFESSPLSPKYSSTFNESLTTNLEKCHIRNKHFMQNNESIFSKTNDYKSYEILPLTPKKQTSICSTDAIKPTNSTYFDFNSKLLSKSPNKEAHDILYANIKPVGARKTFSPQKLIEHYDKQVSPAKKCLFENTSLRNCQLLTDILSTNVIMGNIFKYLSSGDIYRLSLVSPLMKQAIMQDRETRLKFTLYMKVHRENKENYKITPPTSPEKDDSPPGSPQNKVFKEYYKMGRQLKGTQTLAKCLKCGKPSIVENNIGQCQHLGCGYIYCQKCLSCSVSGPEYFFDKCQSAMFKASSRPRLGDLSESSRSYFNVLNSSLNDSSGFYSEKEQTPISARRNLMMNRSRRQSLEQSSVLAPCDNIVTTAPRKRRLSSIVVPVVPIDVTRKKINEVEPLSPPKIRNIACSTQSKRNLKRLTR